MSMKHGMALRYGDPGSRTGLLWCGKSRMILFIITRDTKENFISN